MQDASYSIPQPKLQQLLNFRCAKKLNDWNLSRYRRKLSVFNMIFGLTKLYLSLVWQASFLLRFVFLFSSLFAISENFFTRNPQGPKSLTLHHARWYRTITNELGDCYQSILNIKTNKKAPILKYFAGKFNK